MASFPTSYLPASPLSSPPSLLDPLPSPSASSTPSHDGGASFPFLGLSPLSAFPPSPVSVGSSFNPYSPPPISRTHATSGGGIPYSLAGIAGPGLPCSPAHPTTPFLLHSGPVGRTLRREEGARHHPYQQQESSGLRTLSNSPGVHERRRHGRGGDREASRSRRQSVEGERQETHRNGYVNNVPATDISPPFPSSDQKYKTQEDEMGPRPSGSSPKRRRESSLSAILNRIGLSCCESPGNFITPRCDQLSDTHVDTSQEENIHHGKASRKVAPSQHVQVPSLASSPSPSDGHSVQVLKITSSWCLTGAPSSSRRRTLSVDRIYVPSSSLSQDNRGDHASSSTPSSHHMTFFNGQKDEMSPVLQQPFTHLQRTESRGGADAYRRRAYSLSGREAFHLAPSFSLLNPSGESPESHPQVTGNASQPGGVGGPVPGVADSSPSFFVSSSLDVSPTEQRGRTRGRKAVRDDTAGRNTRACSLWACCCAEGQESVFLDTSRTAGSSKGGEVYRGRPLTRGDVERGGRFASVGGGVNDYYSSLPQMAYPLASLDSSQFRTMSERRWDDGTLRMNGERAPGGLALGGRGGGQEGSSDPFLGHSSENSQRSSVYLIPQWFKCDAQTVGADTPESPSPPSLLGWRDLKEGVQEKRKSPPSIEQIQALCQVLFVGVPVGDSLGESDEKERQKERIKKALEHLTSRLVGLAMDVAALMRLFCGGGGDLSKLRALLLVLQGLLLSAGEASMKDPRGSRYRRKDEREIKEGTERGMHREKMYLSTRTRSHFRQVENFLKDLRGVLLDLIGRRIAGDKQQGAHPSSLGQLMIDSTEEGRGDLRVVAEGLESLSRHLVPSDEQGTTPASQDSARVSTPSLRNQLLQSAFLLKSLLSSPPAAGKVSSSDIETAGEVGSGSQSGRGEDERVGRLFITGRGQDGEIRSPPTGTEEGHQERRPPVETVGPEELIRLLSGDIIRRLSRGKEGREETKRLGGTAEDEQRRPYTGTTGSDKDKRWTFVGTRSYEERRSPSELESLGVRRSLPGPGRGPRIVWTVGKEGIRPAGVYTPGREGKAPLISTGGDDEKTVYIELGGDEERRPLTGEEKDEVQGGDDAVYDWVYKINLNLDNSALQKKNEELEESLANKRKRLEEALKEAALLRWLCEQLADWNGSHKKRSELLDSLFPLLRRLRALQGILKKCSCLYHREEDKLGGTYEDDDDGTPDSKSGGGQGFRNVSKIVREPVVPDVKPVGYADNVFFASLRSSSPIRFPSRSPSGTPGGGSRSPRSMSPSPSRLARDKSFSFKKTLESRDGSDKRSLSLTPPVHHASSLPPPPKPKHADGGTSIHRSKTASPSGRKFSSPSFSRDHSTGGRKSGEAQAGSGGGVRTPRSPRASSVRGSSPRPTSPSAFSAGGGEKSPGRLPVPGSGHTEGTSKRRNVSAPPTGGRGETRGKQQQEEDKTKKKKPTVPALSLKVLTTRRSRSPSPSNASSVVDDASPRRSRREKTDDSSSCPKSPKEPGRGVTESKTKSRPTSKDKEEQARRKFWRISSGASSGGSSSHSFSFEDFLKHRGGSRDSNVARRTDSKYSDQGGSTLDQGGEGDLTMDETGGFHGGDLERLFHLVKEDWSPDDPSAKKTELEVFKQIVSFLDREENQRVIPPDYNNEAVKKCVNVKHLLPSSAKGSLSLALEDPNEMKPEERKLRTMVSFIDGLTKLLAKTNKEDPVLPLIKPLIQCGEQAEVDQCDLSIHFGLERLRRLLLLLRHKGRSGPPLCPSLDEKEEFLKVYGPFIGLEPEDLLLPQGDRGGVCRDETTTTLLDAGDHGSRLPGVIQRESLGGEEEGGDGVTPGPSSKSLRRDSDGGTPPCENLSSDQGTGEVRIPSQEDDKKKPTFPTVIISTDGQTKVISSRDFNEDGSSINDLQDTDIDKTQVEGSGKVSHSEKEASGDSQQGRKGEGEGEEVGGSRSSSEPGDLPNEGGVVPGAEDHGSEGGLPAACAGGTEKKGSERSLHDGRLGERGSSHDGIHGVGEAGELSSSDSSSSLHLHLPGGGVRVMPDLRGLSQYGPICLDAAQYPTIPPLQNFFQSRSNVGTLSGPVLRTVGGGKLPAAGTSPTGLHAFRNGPLGRLPSTTFSVISSSTQKGGGPVSGNTREAKLGEETASPRDSHPREPGSSVSSSSPLPPPYALLPPWLQALPEDFDVTQLRTTPPPPPAFSLLPAPRTSSSGSLEGREQHQQPYGGEEKGAGSCGRSDSSGSATLGRSHSQRLRWVPCVVWAPVAEGDDETEEEEKEKETPGRDGVSSSAVSGVSPGGRSTRHTQGPRQGGASKGTLPGHERQQQASKGDMMSPRSRLKKGGVEYEGGRSVSSPRSMFSPRTLSPRSSTSLQQSGSAGGFQGGSSSPRRSSGPPTALRRGSQQGGREDGQTVGGGGGQGKGDEQRGQVDMRRKSVNRQGMPEIFVRDVSGSHQHGRGGDEDGVIDKEGRTTLAGQRYHSPGNVDSLSRRGMSLQDHKRKGGEQGGEGGSGTDILAGSQPVHAKTHPLGSVTIRRVSVSREPSTMMGRSQPGSPRGKEGQGRLMGEDLSRRRRGDVNDSGKSENHASDRTLSSSPTRATRLSFSSKSRGEREIDGEDDRTFEGGKSCGVYGPPRNRGSGGVPGGYEGLLLRDQTIDEEGGAGPDSPRLNGFMSREEGEDGWANGHFRTRGDSCTSIGDEFLEEGGRGSMGGSASRQWTGKMSLDGDGEYHLPRPMVSEGEGRGGGRRGGGEGEGREDDEGDEDEETLKELLAQTIRDLQNLDHEIYFTERIAREADEIAKEKAAEKDELEKQLEEEEKKVVADDDDDEEDEEDDDEDEGGDDEDLGILEDDGEEEVEEEGEDDEEGGEEEGDEEEEEEEDNDEDADVAGGGEGAAAGSDDGLEKTSDDSSSSGSVPSLSNDITKKKKTQGGEEGGDTEDDVFSAVRKIEGQVKKAASWADSAPKKRLASGEYDDKIFLSKERSSSSIGSPKLNKEMSRTDSSSSSSTTTKRVGSSSAMKDMSRSASLGKPGRKGSKKMVKLSKKRTIEGEAGASSSTKTRPLKRSATMAPTRSHHPLERKATKKVPSSGGGGASMKKKKTKKKTKGSGTSSSKGSQKETTTSDGSKKKRGGGAQQQRRGGGKKKLSRKKKKRLARKAKLAEAARQAAQTAAIAADAPRVLRAHIIMKQEKAKALREQLEAKKARLEQLLRRKQAEHHQLQSGPRGPGGGGVRRMTTEASLSVPGGGGALYSSSSRSPILPRYMRARQLDASPPSFDGRPPRTPSLSPSPSFRAPTRFSSTNARFSRGDEEGSMQRRSTSGAPGGGWLGGTSGGGSLYGGGGMRRATVSPVLGGHESSSHVSTSPDYYDIPNTFWNTGGGIVKWRRPSEEPKKLEPEPRMIPKRKSAIFERVRPKTYVLSEGKGLEGGGIVRSYKDWVRMYYGEERVKEIWGELAKGPEDSSSSPPGGIAQEGENQSSKEGDGVGEDEGVSGQKNGHTAPLEGAGGERSKNGLTLDREGSAVGSTGDKEQHEEKKIGEGDTVVKENKEGMIEGGEEEVSEEQAQKEEENVKIEEEMNGENKKIEEEVNGENKKIEEETNGENKKIEEETNGENKKIEEETNGENKKIEEETNGENKKIGGEEVNGENKKIEEEVNGDNKKIGEEEMNDENKKIEDEMNHVHEKVEGVTEQG